MLSNCTSAITFIRRGSPLNGEFSFICPCLLFTSHSTRDFATFLSIYRMCSLRILPKSGEQFYGSTCVFTQTFHFYFIHFLLQNAALNTSALLEWFFFFFKVRPPPFFFFLITTLTKCLHKHTLHTWRSRIYIVYQNVFGIWPRWKIECSDFWKYAAFCLFNFLKSGTLICLEWMRVLLLLKLT